MSEQDGTTSEAPEATENESIDSSQTEQTDTSSEERNAEGEAKEEIDATGLLDKVRKQNSELKNLRARAKEAEAKASTADDKDKQIAELQSTLLRERVARKSGLPDKLVERLVGDDEESLMADAEALLELFAKKSPPSSKPSEALRGGGRPEQEPEETDVSKIGARMFKN